MSDPARDPRLTPANGRVASAALRGHVTAARFVEGAARQISAPVADLLHAPRGKRQRQVVTGEGVTVWEIEDGWAFVTLARCGYCGYLRAGVLGEALPVTHRISARSTHLYAEADFKAADLAALSYGARVQVIGTSGRFCETPQGFLPSAHLEPLSRPALDPVAEAERFIGTPYLWGGNSGFGIDCSGLVQAACLAHGIAAAGDSDLQAEALGEDVPAGTPPARGDLLFWTGHVAWVRDADHVIHANVHHMAVAVEGLAEATGRIAAQGDGPVTRHKRLTSG
ncbi:C40 family peptidase [Poseidonocella sedimentorum]|uniref:NlpC/P60 family protein n=1 Tax=Poseidonocella sedimentorum TaxID=871652 RepID=A0A1I6DUQ5_9RHOB|nr:NlpC/P60 family protein [Poseidonocella sedimentorum]SFR09087.1 NlpC/P60 family protein [Poseidonocella sedimentorum]